MKSGQSKHGVFVFFHTIAAMAILILAMLGGDIMRAVSGPSLGDLLFTAVYILLTLSIGLLYARYVLHFSPNEVGISLKAPPLKWVIVGICLPLAVTVFYLLFTGGRFVKNEQAGSIFPYLSSAVFSTGIAAGVCEEFIFRGLILRTFQRQWNRAAAVFLPSVLFALLHTVNLRLGWVDFLLLLAAGTAVGVMFSLIALQSGSIWPGAVVHALWNAVVIGGVFIVESPASGLSENFFCRYELTQTSVFLTGGRFGIESALPAITGYCLVSIMAFALLKKDEREGGE